MGSVPVVLVEPVVEFPLSLVGVLIGACVSPFSEGGLDEAFGFAVGARGIGAGEAMLDAESVAGLCEGPRPISWPVIGEKGSKADSQPGVIGQGGAQEVQH